jgi:DNA recombination protein RmuC
MISVLAGLFGLVLGGVVTWAISSKKSQDAVIALKEAQATIQVRDAQLEDLKAQMERQQKTHDEALNAMTDQFELASKRVLEQQARQFSENQDYLAQKREQKMDEKLGPLEELLTQYREKLNEFEVKNQGALQEVKSRAEELLEAQARSTDETRRLNQILGRGDQRGHWGEVQLANILEMSGLKENIDYTLQHTGVNEGGSSQRPDCVINMPGQTHIVVDAKFPFDAFDAGIASQDPAERRVHFEKHAKDLRGHIKVLKDRNYTAVIGQAPEFTVCFVPSDSAINAAIEVDPEILEYAAREKVLVVGPTSLRSLLWTARMVLSRERLMESAEMIYSDAARLYNRIRNVSEHVESLGKNLKKTVKNFNEMVGSVETNLSATARKFRREDFLSGEPDVPELQMIDEAVRPMIGSKWGREGDNELPTGTSDIVDIDGDEEF